MQIMMFGIEAPAAVRVRAPLPTPSPWPGASPNLAAVLGQITVLSGGDQAQLARAFQAAEAAARAPKVKLLGGKTFRGYDDFAPALTAARKAAIAAFGPKWFLNPDLALHARVPAAWVACKLSHGRTSTSPRDMHFPRAQFWPGGVLPTGPDYAEYGQIDPTGDVRLVRAERDAKRAEALAKYPELASLCAGASALPEFELEPTSDGEIEVPHPEYA